MHLVPQPSFATATLAALFQRFEDESLRHLKNTQHREVIRKWIAKLCADNPRALSFKAFSKTLTAVSYAILSELTPEYDIPQTLNDDIEITFGANGAVLPLYSMQRMLRNILRRQFGRKGAVAAKRDEKKFDEMLAQMEELVRREVQVFIEQREQDRALRV